MLAVRGLIEQLELLREYCSTTFPYLEKRVVIGLLVKRLNELRLFDQTLSKVFEDENEEKASKILFGDTDQTNTSIIGVRRMVHQWMLDRYVRELVQGHDLTLFEHSPTSGSSQDGFCSRCIVQLITQLGQIESWTGQNDGQACLRYMVRAAYCTALLDCIRDTAFTFEEIFSRAYVPAKILELYFLAFKM